MKTLRITALAAALTLTFSPAAFADIASTKIAVVNIQEIMRDSTAAKSVREQLDAKQKTFQKEITKREDDLQKADKELGKQRSVLSKEAFEKKALEFRQKATDAQKEVQAKKALLDNAFARSLNDIQKAVTDIIAGLAKEKGFAIAIPTSQILYTDETLDISKEVLERLNQKLPKVSVKFDAKQ